MIVGFFMEFSEEFALIIKKIRQEKGLTQQQLAEKADISTNYVSDLERGRKDVSLKVANQISNALDIRLDVLISFLYEEEKKKMSVDFQYVQAAYRHWKALNEIISTNLASRKVNLPEAISENIACHAMGYTRNMSNSGDATDRYGNLIEIKATSNFNSDLSSFSPDTHFDKLIFVRMNLEEDKAYIYDLNLNGVQFGALKVNYTETVADHQRAGRRPRLSLIQYINQNNLEPVKIVQL